MKNSSLSDSEKELIEKTRELFDADQFNGEVRGKAIMSLYNAFPLEHAKSKIIGVLQTDSLNVEQWYNINDLRLVYFYIREAYGETTLGRVGFDIINSGVFPEEIRDARDAVLAVAPAFYMNVRGENIGDVEVTFEDEKQIRMKFTTPFPCSFETGILKGSAHKFGEVVLIEHASDCCRNKGDDHCELTIRF